MYGNKSYPSQGTCKQQVYSLLKLKSIGQIKIKIIISKIIDSKNLSISFRKGNSGTVEESKDVFQKGVRFTEECDIWCGQQKTS